MYVMDEVISPQTIHFMEISTLKIKKKKPHTSPPSLPSLKQQKWMLGNPRGANCPPGCYHTKPKSLIPTACSQCRNSSSLSALFWHFQCRKWFTAAPCPVSILLAQHAATAGCKVTQGWTQHRRGGRTAWLQEKLQVPVIQD